MKKIECFIPAYDLHSVAEALSVEGVRGLSVTECKGFGVERGFTRGEKVEPGQFILHPKVKVEMVVLEADVERIIEGIRKSLKENMIGQGKIFVSPVEDAVRTRTGERGKDAIM
jgi:nitrogen regulatory protein P-II 1